MDRITKDTSATTASPAIKQEAAEWLIRLDSETPLSANERSELVDWMKQGDVQREALKDIATLWGKMNILTELVLVSGDMGAAGSLSKPKGWGLFPRGLAWAASAASIVFLALLVWPSHNVGQDNGLYVTAVGQQKTIVLHDQSVVQLNTNSQVEIAYSGEHRDIRLLQGEAHFTVAHNKGWPFRVYAGKSRVQALGTAFSVYLTNTDARVTVTDGKVGLTAIKPDNPTVDSGRSPVGKTAPEVFQNDLGRLEAGQSATIKNIVFGQLDADLSLELAQEINEEDIDRQLAWRKGLLMFSGEPLEQVVAEISRYTNLSIEIADPEVRALKIGGQFRVGDTDDMLDSFETNMGLEVQRLGYNQVRISIPRE
ncbi:FecR family protein [Porticoccus sp. GXU_MW_L64]